MHFWRPLALFALFVGVAFCPATASAQLSGHPFGLGVLGGDPSGVTAKYWLDQENAIQASFGWRAWHYEDPHGALVSVDWSYRFATIQPRTPVVRFAFQGGVGGALGILGDNCYHDRHGDMICEDTDLRLYARAPFSFSAFFPKPRLEAFVELAPGMRLLPDPWFVFMGGVGGRFYF